MKAQFAPARMFVLAVAVLITAVGLLVLAATKAGTMATGNVVPAGASACQVS